MNKNDRAKTAKKIALAIANGTPSDQWLDLDKTLAAEGCKLASTEDPRVFKFTDKDGKAYALVASRKQVVQYDSQDYVLFKRMDKMLAKARTQEDVRKVAVMLDDVTLPASLKNDIEKGIEVCIRQIRDGHVPLPVEVEAHRIEQPKADAPKAPEQPKADKSKKASKPKAKKIEVLPKEEQHAEVCRLAVELDGVVEFKQKREGACFWASGDVKAHKDALVRAGFVWSNKRKAYYWKPVVAVAA